MKSVTILGSTGSIGCSTVDVIMQARDQFKVKVLAGGRNVRKLAEQAKLLEAEFVVIADESQLSSLRDLLGWAKNRILAGHAALVEVAGESVDWTMAAIMGAAGLEPTLASIRSSKTVALANKESLVCAGDVMLEAVYTHGTTLLPVDSEHNAIFQSMAGAKEDSVETLILTASGGAFRTWTLDQMKSATPEQALQHPNWSMGAKITVDSATLFNKGLEVIEASRLFNMPENKIEVIVHPQSIIHSMVRYKDGSVLAQLGCADMRIPIAHTLAWPDRMKTDAPRLNFTNIRRLDFEEPDVNRFSALRLAREALRSGGATPAILSAANEVAVDAFLSRRLGFLDIAHVVENTMSDLGIQKAATLIEVQYWDQQARRSAFNEISRVSEMK